MTDIFIYFVSIFILIISNKAKDARQAINYKKKQILQKII